MVCDKCGKEFAEDVRFCSNCGTELVKTAEEETGTVVIDVIEEEAESAVAEAAEEAEVAAIVAEETAEVTAEVAEEAATEATDRKEKKDKKSKKSKKEAVSKTVTGAKEKLSGVFAKKEGQNPERKKLLALVAIVLLIFIPVAFCFRDEETATLSGTSVVQIYSEDNADFAYLLNGEKVVLDDTDVQVEAESADKTTVCYSNGNKELVVLKDGKTIKTGIEDAKGVKVSFAGDTLVYYSDCENTDYFNILLGYTSTTELGTLHLYYIDKGKDMVIESDVVVNSAVLSPNGETVAYVAEYEATDDFKGFYSVNGKRPVEVGKEKRVFAIADKGAYVYYTDDDRIYAQKKKQEGEKLASDIYSTRVLLNADCTEMLYVSDSKTYLTTKAGEKQKVSGKELNSLLVNSNDCIGFDTVRSDKGTVLVTYTNVETFKEQLLYSEYEQDIVYLSETLETERLASSAGEFAIAEDGQSLVYIDDGEVVRVTDFKEGGVKTDLTDEAEAEAIYAGGNLKYVYYLNSDDELFCIKGSKAKRIANDVTSVMISADGTYCYYVVEGEKLCYSKNGKKGKELFEEEDVTVTCKTDSGAVFAQVSKEDTVTLYRMTKKELVEFHSYEANEKSIEDILKEKYGLDAPMDSIFN